jgi:hypothetical protein
LLACSLSEPPFVAGYEAGAEDADSGELLVETLDLPHALFDLDGKTRRAIALDELVMAVILQTIEHEKGFRCARTATSIAIMIRQACDAAWRHKVASPNPVVLTHT